MHVLFSSQEFSRRLGQLRTNLSVLIEYAIAYKFVECEPAVKKANEVLQSLPVFSARAGQQPHRVLPVTLHDCHELIQDPPFLSLSWPRQTVDAKRARPPRL